MRLYTKEELDGGNWREVLARDREYIVDLKEEWRGYRYHIFRLTVDSETFLIGGNSGLPITLKHMDVTGLTEKEVKIHLRKDKINYLFNK